MAENKPLPRRMQRLEQDRQAALARQAAREQSQRQQPTPQQQASPTDQAQLPQTPQSVQDLKQLLQQYSHILSPENKSFILELVEHLEQGGDQEALRQLAARMQQAAGTSQE